MDGFTDGLDESVGLAHVIYWPNLLSLRASITNMVEVENVDNEYEIDEKGRRVLVRSIEATKRAYLRFTNRTSRPVDIWWRDYQGSKRFYVRLRSGSYYNVDSYLTHPWEFTDAATKERYVINNQFIYRAPPTIGDMRHRTNWNITVGVRSLRMAALLTLGLHVRHPDDVDDLGLPRLLAQELKVMVNHLHNPDPEPSVRTD